MDLINQTESLDLKKLINDQLDEIIKNYKAECNKRNIDFKEIFINLLHGLMHFSATNLVDFASTINMNEIGFEGLLESYLKDFFEMLTRMKSENLRDTKREC